MQINRNPLYLLAPLAFLCIIFFSSYKIAHPFYLSVTEVRIDTSSNKVTLSCRIFTDDLQDAIYKLYKFQGELSILNSDVNQDILEKYIKKNVQILLGGQQVKFQMNGYENEEESTWCYLEGVIEEPAKTVTIFNSLLYDFLPDQNNIIHCYLGKERKSIKLKNPDKKAVFKF
jgi:hypothetical protein